MLGQQTTKNPTPRASKPGDAIERLLESMIMSGVPREESEIHRLDVTPEIAEVMLRRNSHNRPYKPALAFRYARDMENKKWKKNGESLKFDWNGVLQDGQHRLHAVIMSGVTIQFDIVVGNDPSVFDTIDTGRARNLRDIFALSGFTKHTSQVAATARLMYEYEEALKGNFPDRWGSVSPQVLEDVMRKNPEILDSVEFVRKCKVRHFPYPSVAMVLHALATKNGDRELVETFFHQYVSLEGITPGSPVLALRNLTDRFRRDRAKLDRFDILAKTIRAWNGFRQGRSLAHLYGARGRNGEFMMPEVEG